MLLVLLFTGYATFKGEKVYGATIYNQTDSSSYYSGVTNVNSIPFSTNGYVANNLYFRLSLTKQSDNGYGSGNINNISILKGGTTCATYDFNTTDTATRTLIRNNPTVYYTIQGQFTSVSTTGNCAISATTTVLQISGNSGLDSPTFRIKSNVSLYPYLILDTSPIPPPYFKSEIYDLTYSTSTNMATVTGYWNATSTSGITEKLNFYQNSAQLGIESFISVTATSTGTFSFTFPWKGLITASTTAGTTTNPIVFTPNLIAELYQRNQNKCTFGGDNSECQILLDSINKSLSNVTEYKDSLIDIRNIAEYPEYECSISSITGCLKNAGVWLAYPSQNSVDNFKTLNEILPTKFPFAYVYQVNDMRLKMFNASPTGTTTIGVDVHNFGQITFLSKSMIDSVPFAGLIKNILGFLCWFMLIEFAYYKSLRMHDSNTPK